MTPALISPSFLSVTDPELLAKLAKFGRAAARGGLAPKSVAALKSDLTIFEGWCEGNGLCPFPASPDTVAAFVEAMAFEGRKPATITRYVASISTIHQAADLASPCTTITVKMAMMAHRRHVGVRQDQAQAIGEKEITEIFDGMRIDTMDSDADTEIASPRLKDLRDVALLLVAHCTLARASEITAMLWQDLHVEPDGEGSILIRRSKTDQAGEGMIRWLSAEAVSALLRWKEAHDTELAQRIADEPERFARLMAEFQRPKISRGGKLKAKPPVSLIWEPSIYLFRGLATAPVYEVDGYRPNGKAIKSVAKTYGWSLQMTPLAITQIFRRRLKAAGYKAEDIEAFSAHSTRIGSAQDLAREGADLAAIMQAGGWRDPKMAARYTERQAVKQARGVQIMRSRPLLRRKAKADEETES